VPGVFLVDQAQVQPVGFIDCRGLLLRIDRGTADPRQDVWLHHGHALFRLDPGAPPMTG